MTFILPPKAPNLHNAPREYDPRQQEQFYNALRLYFNQLDNAFQTLLNGSDGGKYIRSPYGAFSDYTDQTAASTTAAYAMKFATTDYANGVSVVNTTRLTVQNSGIYNLQFSAQLDNSAVQEQDVSIWLRINGTDVVGSTGFVAVVASHGGTNGHALPGWNYFLQLNANDYVEIMWSTTSLNVSIQHNPTQVSPTRPSTASTIATLTFVSGLPT
jgi:hypothetical protein